MASLSNKVLFFTTSPRSPLKMVPEIVLLDQQFSGMIWNNRTQIEFIDALATSDFFEGVGSPSDKAFSARDRINRAPKSLGFVDLNPTIQITPAGREFIYGKRYQEVFLRQILKFQLPSPYHVEKEHISGAFRIRPYLEIFRLIRELGYLTFDELKIFAVQLTDYNDFIRINQDIIKFRSQKERHRGNYKQFAFDTWNQEISKIYSDEISSGNTQTRQSSDRSLKKFLATKRSNLRDYTDACFRYLRLTGLVTISHRGRSLSFFHEKLHEIDYILSTVNREPVFVSEIDAFKEHLFNPYTPTLYIDEKGNIIDLIMRSSGFTRRDLASKTVEELKNLRDEIVEAKRAAYYSEQVSILKSYSLYSEIIDTYNEVISDELYDAPLILEWNTWRAMTMLNGGNIKGNFKVDDVGQPMSTAQGNMPDIECDYRDFSLSVEVTLQAGQRQYESEGEPVARHYGQLKKRTGKETYCLFIAPTINHATLAHFYMLNKIDVSYYGGKAKIIPLELDQFMKLVENSYNYKGQPTEQDVKSFLDTATSLVEQSANETTWLDNIYQSINTWPS